MSEHTKEPWRLRQGEPWHIEDTEGSEIVFCNGDCSDSEDETNARRIVACVNLCAGVSTKDLEDGLYELRLAPEK